MDTGFHAISFQSNDYYQMGNLATTSTRFMGNNNSNNNIRGVNNNNIHSVSSGGSVLGESGSGLKHDTGFAVEWSVEEQQKLEEGLSKFADEPSIMRYIKIAAAFRDKTVRDVALRCKWMARKRKKQDDPHIGKRLKDKKDKLVESSSKQSISPVPTFKAPFSATLNNRIQIDSVTFEALSGSIRNLLEQNNQVLGQILANMSLMKLQENIDLFSHTKNNITAILNEMRYIPGPPFPVSLNEDLAHSILPTTNQRMMFEASNGMYMKQEPGF
ncbi:uncharacterized protein LOC143602604 [Bidens hawaiensis]|uniref:uncharacterized protein LOC143602604 n=1 Tax=Bidens hawaiensis TaxID=980011 RepID=UPI00404B56E5